jgi:orotate phosphoribosyltransferase
VTRDELARRIHEVSNLRGRFTLRSGVVADSYFDKYRFEGDPELLSAIACAMRDVIPSGVDALAGLEMGGIPLATALSRETGLPALFVRKVAKEHGTRKLAEGGEIEGRNLLIVEDVVTSGGQILLSTADLRGLGASVSRAVCVIDRESGGREKLAENSIALDALFTMGELEKAGVESPGLENTGLEKKALEKGRTL